MQAGAKIGTWEVLGELGRGGFGVVYRVRDPEGSEAALKLLLEPLNAEARQRFEREARILHGLQHPGLVRALDHGVTPAGLPWLTLELLPGGSLAERVRVAGPLDLDDGVALGRALASALGALHLAGVLHRDLKPQNVLFDAAGAPRITDLGLGLRFTPDASRLTATGVILGTPAYMAPEQANGEECTPATDTWALGATLYFAFTGQAPFPGPGALATLQQVLVAQPKPPSALRPDLPPTLDALLLRCLAKEPLQRPTSTAIERELSGLVLSAPRGAVVRRRGASVLVACGLAGLGLALAARARPAPPTAPSPAPPAEVAPQPTSAGPLAPPGPAEPAPPPPAMRSPLPTRLQSLLEQADERRARDLEGSLRLADEAVRRGPEYALVWSVRGNLRKQAGHLEGARQDLDRAIELDPALPAPRWIRGRLRMEQGDLAGAHEDLERAVALGPDQAYAFAYRAELRIVEENTVGALEDVLAALLRLRKDDRVGVGLLQGNRDRLIETLTAAGLAPDAPARARAAGLWARAEGRALRDDTKGALADLDESLALDPGRARPWVLRAKLRWGRSRDRFGVLQDLERAVALAPDEPDVVANRAAFLLETGHVDEAMGELDRLLERCPQLQPALGLRGAAWAQQGDRERALTDLGLALQLDPADRVTLSNRARLLAESGDYPAASRDLDRAFALGRPTAEDLYVRGQVRAKLGDLAGGLADLNAALELAPDQPEFLRTRAQVRTTQGDTPGAHRDLTRALELAPKAPWAAQVRDELARQAPTADDSATPEVLDLLRRAQAQADAGQLAAALLLVDQALAVAPGAAAARPLAARSHLRGLREDLDGAEADARRALELGPDLAQPHGALGAVLGRRGRWQEALDELDRALELMPDFAMARYHRAEVRLELDDARGALEDIERILPEHPRSPDALLVRARARARLGEHERALADVNRLLEMDPKHARGLALRAQLVEAGR